MKISKELQKSFKIFQKNYDSFFEAIHSVAENKKFSALEFEGVIHRTSALTLFAMDCLNVYLTDKGFAESRVENEEAVVLAYKHKIVTSEGNWLLAVEMLKVYFFSHDKHILTKIIAFINEIFQDLIIELYNYFADKIKI